jgi:VIT1/CCC1 family predicted Fe2+/Mn2+ transporter
MAEKQKLKFGEAKCPVCGTLIHREIERDVDICPKCGVKSPVLSPKQINGFASLWTISVLGLAVGVMLLIFSDFLGMGLLLSVIAFLVGGICLVGVIVFTVLRKKKLNEIKLKWQSEHPTT